MFVGRETEEEVFCVVFPFLLLLFEEEAEEGDLELDTEGDVILYYVAM